ncbi:FecR domain-containing protein [Pseudomonas sp. OTU750018]|uniref:FecR domain-containing protein n=1 Tax=Pseudomonas sp. OTU750018 TaxID=2709708 RepID=UPI00141DE58F|nr:FecR family protein [Pseudomonas sp. OTU750018]
MSAKQLDRHIAHQAAQWFVKLHDDPKNAVNNEACAQWRASNPDHERAWQLAQRFSCHVQSIPQNVGMHTLDRPQGIDRRSTIKALAILVSAGPAAVLAYRATPWQTWLAEQRTATGEQRQMVLPDGTHVHLNTSSAMDVRFDDEAHRVRLFEGEILVSTAQRSDSARDLVIETRDGSIRPVGTRFLVRQREDCTDVAVFEGRVAIQPSHLQLPQWVEAGQQRRFTQRAINPAQANDRNADGWSQGVLRVENMPLARFSEELSRYRPGILRCDPAVASVQISGVFQLRDTDQALAALTKTLPVDVLYRTRYWVTIAPRNAAYPS